MDLTFEWHEEKAKRNLKKHGVDFHEAKTVFNDPSAMTVSDPDHSMEEDRYVEIGRSAKGRLLVVVYTERGMNIRLISSRPATMVERKIHEEG